MGFKETILLYLITAAVFFVIDLFWLGVFAKGFYDRHLGHLLSEQVNWTAAVLFYAIYIGGVLVFVLWPGLRDGAPLYRIALMGGLLGLFAYATFDLTNLALIRQWPAVVVWVDIAWGIVLTAGVSAISALIARRVLM